MKWVSYTRSISSRIGEENPSNTIAEQNERIARYLKKCGCSVCVESILAQTWQNYEVILVDDGSTDSSGKMCDDYARKNTRVRVIHKKMGDCLLQEMRALILHWATILHL